MRKIGWIMLILLISMLPLHASAYTLDALIGAMEVNNAELRKADEDVVQSRLDVKDAKAAYQPTVHSKTLMMGAYRAPSYAGLMITPIIKFTKTFFLQISGGYFQPFRALEETAAGGYRYTAPFPEGSFIGNAALVWQSPIGPISLSCAYYEGAERAKWYPSFNIGYLIFREHGLRN